MNLNTVTEVKHPHSAEDIREWHEGCAYLAGGTWLFSEPQVKLTTLIDIEGLGWTPLEVTPAGLDIAATCKIAELYHFKAPAEWRAAAIFRDCCEAFLASFKIWNASTVGGNVVMSLPAGPMISLTAALEGVCTLLPRAGNPRQVTVADFVTGNNQNVLAPGELLRNIRLPAEALTKHAAFRRSSLTHLGRSSVFLIGTRSAKDDSVLLTVTAATIKPVQLRFAKPPSAQELEKALDSSLPLSVYYHDVHGSPFYRRHLTYYFAEQIRVELEAKAGGAKA